MAIIPDTFSLVYIVCGIFVLNFTRCMHSIYWSQIIYFTLQTDCTQVWYVGSNPCRSWKGVVFNAVHTRAAGRIQTKHYPITSFTDIIYSGATI